MTKASERQRSPSSELMGSRFLSYDAERREITVEYTPPLQFVSPRGAVQGGLIVGFLDEVMGGAMIAYSERELEEPRIPLNLDVKVSYMRMVPMETFIGKGRVVKAGRRVVFLEGELYDKEGNLLTRATSTALPTPLPEGLMK